MMLLCQKLTLAHGQQDATAVPRQTWLSLALVVLVIKKEYIILLGLDIPSQGRRPRGDWGDGPPKFEVGGGGPGFGPPIILRSRLVDGSECLNRVQNRCRQGIFC